VAEEDWREREKEKSELKRLIKIDELTEEVENSEARKRQYGNLACIFVLTFFSFIYLFDNVWNVGLTNVVANLLVMISLVGGVLFGILHYKESSKHKKLIARIKLERKFK
tara:strand:+ start:100 stop:429 length:330 start_codon:yes stop_codon:yes gene_type:complete